jgi:hypothetical protein
LEPIKAYKVKTRFQPFAFKCNLYRYTGAGQYVAHLGGVASAVEMLNSRVELLLRYLKVRGLYSCVCVSKP